MDVSVDVSSPAGESHFPFDWTGWGSGPESMPSKPDQAPGAKIAEWNARVQAIVEQC
jgi:hypothetical protein